MNSTVPCSAFPIPIICRTASGSRCFGRGDASFSCPKLALSVLHGLKRWVVSGRAAVSWASAPVALLLLGTSSKPGRGHANAADYCAQGTDRPHLPPFICHMHLLFRCRALAGKAFVSWAAPGAARATFLQQRSFGIQERGGFLLFGSHGLPVKTPRYPQPTGWVFRPALLCFLSIPGLAEPSGGCI